MWLYRIINFITRIVFFSVYPRKINGRGNIPSDGPVIIVCNHMRFHDIFNIATCFRRRLIFMAKKELFKGRMIAFLFRKYGSFPVDREIADMQAIRDALGILKKGGVLVIFPEGTRTHGKVLGEIKEGTALLAYKSGATILPMYINNREKLFHRMVVNIGEPFRPEPIKRVDSQALKELTQEIRERMIALHVDLIN